MLPLTHSLDKTRASRVSSLGREYVFSQIHLHTWQTLFHARVAWVGVTCEVCVFPSTRLGALLSMWWPEDHFSCCSSGAVHLVFSKQGFALISGSTREGWTVSLRDLPGILSACHHALLFYNVGSGV